MVHAESDLVRSFHAAEIFGQLINGGVRYTRSRLRGEEIERARNAKKQHFGIIRRVVKILNPQVTPCEKVRKGFHIASANNRPTEGTYHVRTDRIGVSQNKRLDSPVKVRVGEDRKSTRLNSSH